MATSTMSVIANGLMVKQEKFREEHIWGEDQMYKMVTKSSKRGVLAGRSGQSQWSNKTYESNASGAHSENGAFATARTNGHTLATVSGVRLNFPMRIGGDVLAYAQTENFNYMARALEEQTEEVFSAIRFYCATAWFANADNVLGTVNGTPSGTTNGTFVVDEAFGASHIRRGMFLTAHASPSSDTEEFTNGVNRVVDVDRTTNTVMMADLTDLADNDVLIRDGHYGQSAPNGLRNLVGTTGTVNNINRSTAGNNFYKAFVLDRGGSPLTEANTRTLGNYVKHYSAKPDGVNLVIVMHPDNAQILWNVVGDYWRFSDKGTAEIGFGDVKIHTPYGTVVVMETPMCHKDDIYYLNPKDFKFYAPPSSGGVHNTGEWYAQNGNIMHPIRSSDSLTDAWEMVRILRYQWTATRFDRMGKITDFT